MQWHNEDVQPLAGSLPGARGILSGSPLRFEAKALRTSYRWASGPGPMSRPIQHKSRVRQVSTD
jgi:hypothetical protein